MTAKRTTRSTGRKSGHDTAPAPTLVLLVRHGKTPTTGSVLPGRAGGSAPRGRRRRASRSGRRRASPSSTGHAPRRTAPRASPPSTPPRWSAPRRRRHPSPRRSGCGCASGQGLIECDFGEWTGRKLSDLAKLPEWQTVQRHPAGFRFPKGESFAEMQARMVDTVNDLVSEHPGESIVAVSHADTIKAAVAQALGTPLDLFQRIVIGQCSVSAILYGPAGPTVLAVNHTGTSSPSFRHDLATTTPTRLHRRRHRPTRRARLLPPGPSNGPATSVKLEKQQVLALAEYLVRSPARPPRPRRGARRPQAAASRSTPSGRSAPSASPTTTTATGSSSSPTSWCPTTTCPATPCGSPSPGPRSAALIERAEDLHGRRPPAMPALRCPDGPVRSRLPPGQLTPARP